MENFYMRTTNIAPEAPKSTAFRRAMPRALYTFTHYTTEHGSAYSCDTYRASLSRKYGICQSLHDPNTLDLGAISWGPVSVGNAISVFVLLVCVLVVLGLLKWALDKRRQKSWEWWTREGQEGRLVARGGRGRARKERLDADRGWWAAAGDRGGMRECRLS